MEYYPTILTMHIIFAGIWLINLFSDSKLRSFVFKNKNKIGEKKFIILYLTFVNLFGIIGAAGILVTGISMVVLNSGYGFFQMTANHWLAAKQILMIVLLLIIAAFVIPTAKKIRKQIGEDLESPAGISEEAYINLKKLYSLNTIINVIVLINFLFAITHRLF